MDDGGDLSIGWISRAPAIDYVWGSANPTRDGWPALGQRVTWQAHVKNWAKNARQNVAYRWLLDGVAVDSGKVEIPANSVKTVDFPWDWKFERHELKFVIDPANAFKEEEERNNDLLIYTDAITIGFYVEQSVYDYFRQHQRKLGLGSSTEAGSNTWEDWAQRHIRRWNRMLANAIYPETPNGVLDRVRLEKITVVPDGALPLVPLTGINQPDIGPSSHPNRNDRTVNMQWGFPAELLKGSFYQDHTAIQDYNPFYYQGSLVHELGHARYLTDIYAFRVFHGVAGEIVEIQENGANIAGTKYMPGSTIIHNGERGLILYRTPFQGLMNTTWTYMDRYSAITMNLIAGHRATRGNCNEPENIGIFLNDLPAENRLTVRDAFGTLLKNAEVWIYQAVGQKGYYYSKRFDNIPDLKFVTDDQGQILLGRNPFSLDGIIRHTWEVSNAAIIIRVAHAGRVGYSFLEVSLFNMEYWCGNKDLGKYQISVNLLSN